MNVNIGISKEDREKVAEGLSKVLADSYLLYLKTHNYHWNVTGELFHALHEQFEEQYSELAPAIDEIAERIRIIGFPAPGTFKEFSKITSIKEETDHPDAMEMVKRLKEANEQVIDTVRDAMEIADSVGDEATIDLLAGRLTVHSKTAWILGSHLEQ